MTRNAFAVPLPIKNSRMLINRKNKSRALEGEKPLSPCRIHSAGVYVNNFTLLKNER
jgi:hypothetical protein